MSVGIFMAIGSAMFQPLYSGLSKKGNHPLTVNFWGMALATLVCSFCFWQESYWERISDCWQLVFLSSILKVLYVNINLPLLARYEFQVLYPLTRIAPILIMIGEIVWLKSSFNFWQIAGVVSVILGTLIFGFDKKIHGFRAKIFSLILLMTVFYTMAILIDKKLTETFSTAEIVSFALFQLPFLAPILFLQKEAAKKDLININTLKCSLAMLGSYFLMVGAFQYLDATIVSSIRSLSILFGIFLGAHFFDEGHKLSRYLAASLICAGIFLIIL